MPRIEAPLYGYRDDPAVPSFDDAKPLFVFDGVCVLCSRGAAWLIRHDRNARVNLTSAQSPIGKGLYEHYGVDFDETYLLIKNGQAFSASKGYLELVNTLGGLWRVFGIASLLPERWRDGIYNLVARNRYRWFGKTEHCALLTGEQRARLLV